MPTREFPASDLEQLIRFEDNIDSDTDYTFLAIEETHGVVQGTDSLGQWNLLYFIVDGVTYRVKFIEGNTYYRSEVGWWEGSRFDGPYGCDPVECTAVELVAKTTYSYQPIK